MDSQPQPPAPLLMLKHIIAIAIVGSIIFIAIAFIIFGLKAPRFFRRNFLKCLGCCFECCPIRFSCSKWQPENIEDLIDRFQDDIPEQEEYLKRLEAEEHLKKILEVLNAKIGHFQFTILAAGSTAEGYGKIQPSTSILASDYDLMLSPWRCYAKLSDDLKLKDEVALRQVPVKEEQDANIIFEGIRMDGSTARGRAEAFCVLRLRKEENTNRHRHWLEYTQFMTNGNTNEEIRVLSNESVKEQIQNALLKEKVSLQNIDDNAVSETQDYHTTTIETKGPSITVKTKRKAWYTKFLRKYQWYPLLCCFLCCCYPIICCWSFINFCFDDCFKKREDLCTFECDLVLAICCQDWPEATKEWFTRIRKWPAEDTIEKIRSSVIHLIPKPSGSLCAIGYVTAQPLDAKDRPKSFERDIQFRFSFSQAEMMLSKKVPPKARQTYIAFKSTIKRLQDRLALNIKIESFAIKSIFYRTLEQEEEQNWYDGNKTIRQTFLNKLIQELDHNLANGNCPHYWIESDNLFSCFEVNDDDLPEVITNKQDCHGKLHAEVKKIRNNVRAYLLDDWIELNRCITKHCCMRKSLLTGKRSCRILIPSTYPEKNCCCGGCSREDDLEYNKVIAVY